MNPCRINEDGRDVKSLDVSPFTEESRYFLVGSPEEHPCTAIVAYEEPGQGAMTPWFAIYFEGDLKFRVSASHCIIEYD